MIQRRIVPIVEGYGEKAALPILLRRLLFEVLQRFDLVISAPILTKDRGALIKRFEQFLAVARLEPQCAAILVVLDADADCASELAIGLSKRAASFYVPFPVAIVCAKCEYETWFLASLESIVGKHPGLKPDAIYDKPVEELGSVKGWFKRQMLPGRTYKEPEDQPAMTQLMDFDLVRQRSRSFRRLEHALEELLQAIDSGEKNIVTPLPKDSENG